MNYLREVVAGKKKRFKEEGYNLDLSYVTGRIIAMSFPGEGLTGLYRNPIDQVVQLLNTNHKENYHVYNLCGKKYNYQKFNNMVSEYQWEDHHSPALDVLFKICQQVHTQLTARIENVVVIHCLAGKGRTGTVICCYLLYSGRFKTVEDVLYYYSRKRFMVEGLGVNQPCQLRYIYYFFTILTGVKLYPTVIMISKFRFVGRSPDFNMGGGCKPFVEILSVRKMQSLWNQKNSEKEIEKYQQQQAHIIKIECIKPLCGDILINIQNAGMFKDNKMCRLSFNTAFLNNQEQQSVINSFIDFQLVDLDPNQVLKDERFHKDFQIQIEIVKGCKKQNCTNTTKFQDKCDICMGQIGDEINSWETIYAILDCYIKPTIQQATMLLFGNEFDDVDDVILLKRNESGEIQLEKDQKEQIENRIKSPTYTFQLEQNKDGKQVQQ